MFDFFEFSQFDHILAVQPISLRDASFAPALRLAPVTSVLSASQKFEEDVHIADLVIDSENDALLTISVTGQQSIYFEIRDSALILKKGTDLRLLNSSIVKVELKCEWSTVLNRQPLYIDHSIVVSDSASPEELLKLQLNSCVSAIDFAHQIDTPLKIAEIERHDLLLPEHLVFFGPDADMFFIEGNDVYIRPSAMGYPCITSTKLLIVGFRHIEPDVFETNHSDHAVSYSDKSHPGVSVPVLMSAEKSPLMYAGGGKSVSVTDTLLALSPVSGYLDYATIVIDRGYQKDFDKLGMVANYEHGETPASIYTYFDEESGTFHISGKASASVYVGIIRSIVFSSASAASFAPKRLIRISVAYDNQVSNIVHRDIAFVTKSQFAHKLPVNANSACDLTVGVMQMQTLNTVWLDNILLMHEISLDYSTESLLQVIEPPAGVDIFVQGESCFSFTVEDIANGDVCVSHNGTLHNDNKLYVEFSKNGINGVEVVGLSLTISLDQSRDIALADNVFDKRYQFVNPDEMNYLSEDDSDRPDHHAVRKSVSDKPSAGFHHYDQSDDPRIADKEVLLSLRLPGCPGPLVVYQAMPGVQELVNVIFEHTGDAADVQEYRDELLTTLLDLNPLTVAADFAEWSEWCDVTASDKDRQQRLHRLFRTQAVSLEKSFRSVAASDQINSTTVVRYMTDGLRDEFVVWLLSRGYLAGQLVERLGSLSRAA